MNVLSESDDGRTFAEELDAFLNLHGKRMSDWGIRHGSWIEDPSPVMITLKGYVEQEGDPRDELEERAAERDEVVAAARERLQGYPSDVRDEFEHLLKVASTAVVLTEDHGYWIDFQSTYRVRRVVMEMGKRLAEAGTLATAGDVFVLRTDEIAAAVGASPAADHTGLVEERKKEMEHFGSLKPPLFMGTDYGPPPPGLVSDALGKFFGAPVEQDRCNGRHSGRKCRITGQVPGNGEDRALSGRSRQARRGGDSGGRDDVAVVDAFVRDCRRHRYGYGRHSKPLRRGGSRVSHPGGGRNRRGDQHDQGRSNNRGGWRRGASLPFRLRSNWR